MGIQGLLPFLKPIHRKSSISKFKAESVAVDGFCWLHKAAYSCAQDLALGIPTNTYITVFSKKLRLLLDENIKPIIVFDGNRLPAKKHTDDERTRSRKENLEIAKDYLANGNKSKAYEFFQKSISISFDMVSNIMKACKEFEVSCLVAPFEADAQLVCLQRLGLVSLIISEDSDLLVFGCTKIFYKMDSEGNGILIDGNDLHKVPSCKELIQQKGHWAFRQMCVLSGCDYLESIRGVGLMTACKLMINNNNAYEAINSLRNIKGLSIVPLDYNKKFKMAENVFLHQIVFNPITQSVQYFSKIEFTSFSINKNCEIHSLTNHDLDWKELETNWIGNLSTNSTDVLQFALGNINVKDGKAYANFTTKDFKSLYYCEPLLQIKFDNKENFPETFQDSNSFTKTNKRITLDKLKSFKESCNNSSISYKSNIKKIYTDPFAIDFKKIDEACLTTSIYFSNVENSSKINEKDDDDNKKSLMSPTLIKSNKVSFGLDKSINQKYNYTLIQSQITENKFESKLEYIDEDIVNFTKSIITTDKTKVKDFEIQSFKRKPKRLLN